MKQLTLRIFDRHILKKAAVLAATVSALLLFTATLASGQEQGDDDGEAPVQGTIQVEQGADLQALAKITPDEAKAAALDSVSGATAEEAELENENGYLVYAVDLMKNGQEMEVLVDAGNGSVLHMEADDEDGENGDDEQYEEDGENEAGEQADLPQAVRDAFQNDYPSAQITGTDVEEEGGETFYEVESRDGETTRDLLYRPDGRVYETEEQVAAAALPDAVRQAAEEQDEIVKAERITRESGAIEYEIAVRQNGAEHEVVLDANGQVLEDAGSDEQ